MSSSALILLTVLVSTQAQIQKCCNHGFAFKKYESSQCVATTDFVNIPTYTLSLVNVKEFRQYQFGFPRCTNGDYQLSPELFKTDTFYLQGDGRLWIESTNAFIDKSRYCIDGVVGGNATVAAYVCFPDTPSESNLLNGLGMIISMPFLLITFIVYALLPERNVHAKCLMCYVSSLMCAYMFLVIMQFSANLNVGCIVLAVLCLYFFMTSFCWMNISCIDIFWTFSGKRGFGLTNKSAEMKRFLLYCTYTYGLPLILIGLVLGLNNMEDKSAWYHPNFANAQCWLGSGYPLLIYFYGPMGIMLVFNIVLFTLTALKIRQINNDTAMLNKAESQKHYENDKQTFNLYFKLLLALGINWIMEFISWLVDWMLPEHKKIPQIWYLTDFCNAIYGVFIFIIFVCKRNILMLLKKRYYIFMGQPQKARNLSMRTSSYEMSQTEKSVVY